MNGRGWSLQHLSFSLSLYEERLHPNGKNGKRILRFAKAPQDFGRKPLDALPAPFVYFSTRRVFKRPADHSPFTDAEWEAACAIYRAREDAARPAWLRYTQVRNTVTDACRQGQLAFGLRPRAGGAVYAGKPEWWETEGNTLHYRLEWFRMSSVAPFIQTG